MAKGRKNGCPVNIRHWLISILDVGTQEFVRIFGLNSMTRNITSETEDGSADTDIWTEPYVTKRSSSVSLEGKPVVDEVTGAVDEGQELLTSYVDLAGCDGDATLKFVSPYGHAFQADYIVTSKEEGNDDSGSTVSFELEQVGEAEVLPYVAVTSIALKDGETSLSGTLTMTTSDGPKIITVAFTPEGASNKRFKVSNNKRSVVTVSAVTETGFTLTPVAAGSATITVTSVNGAKTVTLAVTVT
jgi:hypothetical protein